MNEKIPPEREENVNGEPSVNGTGSTEEKLGDASIRWNTPFGRKVANFFYYYKWHVVAALAAVAILITCLVQCGTRTVYDGYLLYAGGTVFSRTASDGDVSPYAESLATLRRYTGDKNGDGQVNVSFLSLFQPSEAEIREIESDGTREVNYTLMSQDAAQLKDLMVYGDYYVCLLSPSVFRVYEEGPDGLHYFMPVADYLPQDASSISLVSDYGVAVSSLKLSAEPGFNILPADTILCLRARNEVVGAFRSDKNTQAFTRAEELFRSLLVPKG